MSVHFMDQITADRLDRERREIEKARRQREAAALPRYTQTKLLSHTDDLAGQGVLFEEDQ